MRPVLCGRTSCRLASPRSSRSQQRLRPSRSVRRNVKRRIPGLQADARVEPLEVDSRVLVGGADVILFTITVEPLSNDARSEGERASGIEAPMVRQDAPYETARPNMPPGRDGPAGCRCSPFGAGGTGWRLIGLFIEPSQIFRVSRH